MPSRVPRPLRPRRSFLRTARTAKGTRATRNVLSSRSPGNPRISSASSPAGIKKNLTRLTIFIAIAFALVQISLAGDPVQMYLQTVGDAASPAMDFSADSIPVGEQGGDMWIETLASSENPLPAEAQNLQNGQMFLRPIPAQEGIRIWQDNKYLGEIPSSGKIFSVKPGRVTLQTPNPGNNNAQNISVEIFYLGQNYTLSLPGGKATFDVNR